MSRFSEERIIAIRKSHESGVTASDAVRALLRQLDREIVRGVVRTAVAQPARSIGNGSAIAS